MKRENPDTILEDLHKYRAKLSKKFAKMTNQEIVDYYRATPSCEEFLARLRKRKKAQHA